MLFPTGKLQVSQIPSPNSLSAIKEKGKQSKQSLYHVSFKYSTDCRQFSNKITTIQKMDLLYQSYSHNQKQKYITK